MTHIRLDITNLLLYINETLDKFTSDVFVLYFYARGSQDHIKYATSTLLD